MTPNERFPSRLILLDSARVLAIVFMIQGHTLDVLLAPAYRHGAVFTMWLFLRGLTAPTFFVLSGMSFTVSSLRHWDSYIQFSPALFKRLRRYAFFIFLGYVMHWPVKSFREIRYLDAAAWQSWFQVDVLQCVGLTLVFLQLLIFLVRIPKKFGGLAIGLCAGVVLFTPIVWEIDWSRHVPLWIASFMNARTGSLFSLFPWSGYILFGAALGYAYMHWWSDAKSFSRWSLAGGGLILASGLCANAIPVVIYPQSQYWATSPNTFLIRVGCVCFLLAILAFATERMRIPRLPVNWLARESLTIYLIHISILYGSNWNRGLRQAVGANLTPFLCFGWICVLVFSMMLLGWVWSWYKRGEPETIRLVRSAVFLLALVYIVA